MILRGKNFGNRRSSKKKATAGFIISLIAGILILINDLMFVVLAEFIESLGGRASNLCRGHFRNLGGNRRNSCHSSYHRCYSDLHARKRNHRWHSSDYLFNPQHLHRWRLPHRINPRHNRRSLRLSQKITISNFLSFNRNIETPLRAING